MQQCGAIEKNYAPTASSRVVVVLFLILGPSFLVSILILRIAGFGGKLATASETIVLILILSLMFAAIGLGFSWVTMKVSMRGNLIVIKNIFRQKQISISEISSTKIFYTKNGPMLFIVHHGKKTSLPYIFSQQAILDIAAKIEASSLKDNASV